MNVDVYIFLRFVVIFSEFFEISMYRLRVSPETDPSRRDLSVLVPAESATETATVNHDTNRPYWFYACLLLPSKPCQVWLLRELRGENYSLSLVISSATRRLLYFFTADVSQLLFCNTNIIV